MVQRDFQYPTKCRIVISEAEIRALGNYQSRSFPGKNPYRASRPRLHFTVIGLINRDIGGSTAFLPGLEGKHNQVFVGFFYRLLKPCSFPTSATVNAASLEGIPSTSRLRVIILLRQIRKSIAISRLNLVFILILLGANVQSSSEALFRRPLVIGSSQDSPKLLRNFFTYSNFD